MLLNMMCGRRLSAISLCLAVTFAPLFNAQADEPEVIPGDSPVAVSEQGEALPQAQATAIMAGIQPLPEGAAEKARTQIESQLPAGYKPVYLNQLQLLYAARDTRPVQLYSFPVRTATPVAGVVYDYQNAWPQHQ